MDKRSERFGIKLGNLPILAIRREFNTHHWLIAKPKFRESLTASRPPIAAIETPYFTWRDAPAGFLTLITQRAFTGIEMYVVGAAYWQVGRATGLTSDFVERLMDPVTQLKGQGVADTYYNRVPSLASSSFALEQMAPQLWKDAKTAYREVRNPIFHGYQVDDGYATGVLAVYDFIADLYRWIDSWHDLNDVLPGAAEALRPKPRGAA